MGASIRKIRNPKKAQYFILDEDIGPLFWLVPEVIIKARLGMEDATDKEIPNLIDELDKVLLEGL